MSTYKSFGSWLRDKRNGLGMRQEDLADAADIGLKSIQNYERGANLPSDYNARKLVQALRLSTDEQDACVKWVRRLRMARQERASGGAVDNRVHPERSLSSSLCK
jgi:transcriptional regulator with XRE-family HTH domain